jgi:hypothetical protein
VLLSVTIDEASLDASHARTDIDAEVASRGGAWIGPDTAAVPFGTTTQLEDFLVALGTINGAHDPVFSCGAVVVPTGQFSFVTDKPANTAAVTAIMGRKPVGA